MQATRTIKYVCKFYLSLSLRSRDVLHIPPALEQRPPGAVHPRVGAVVRVFDVGDYLLRRPPVARRERLVPGREDVLVRVGARVLWASMSETTKGKE